MDVTLRYELKHLSVDQLNAEIDKVWEQLSTDPELRKEVAEANIDLQELSLLSRREAIEVRREGAGFDYTPIVVAFAPVVAKIAKDVWVKIILPRISSRKGMDAVTPKHSRRK